MKKIDSDKLDQVRGQQLKADEKFCFRCHPDISCFNKCCRNLNLFLYPYDLLRLKTHLNMTSSEFLERHTDVIMRPGDKFPDVLLRMADNEEKTCPFLTDEGCSVYANRPDTCRTFPVEHGLSFDDAGKAEMVYFFRPPDFCMGQHEEQEWTIKTWAGDQEAEEYSQMTAPWAEIRSLFQSAPQMADDPQGQKARMAFMAAYNTEDFKEFVFHSSFLKRYKIKKELQRKLRRSDTELLLLGFEWIKFFLWGMPPTRFKIKK